MDKKKEIIQEVIRVANLLSPSPLTEKEFRRQGKVPMSTLKYYFGSFNKAVTAAGLSPNRSGVPVSGYQTIPDQELLLEIDRLWKQSGKRPTRSLMDSEGKYSVTPYKKRWGSFERAIEEYVLRQGEPLAVREGEVPDSPPQPRTGQIIIPSTHKPIARPSDRARILYGEPLEFRGLRYAPVNEQGVVYLFGMVSRELGFLIESIRTDFPDCEGKRCVNPEGTKWEHVRIEFEHKSSNFQEHGHDPEQCDLIVCWIHDWKECPLEVLELRTEIKKLRRD